MERYKSFCPHCRKNYYWVGYKTRMYKTPEQIAEMDRMEKVCQHCGEDGLKTDLDYGDNSSQHAAQVLVQALSEAPKQSAVADTSDDRLMDRLLAIEAAATMVAALGPCPECVCWSLEAPQLFKDLRKAIAGGKELVAEHVFVVVPTRNDGNAPSAVKVVGHDSSIDGSGTLYHSHEDAETARAELGECYEVRRATVVIGEKV